MDALIVRVVQRYHPEWEPPTPGRGWRKCHCPFHGDERASAAVNYDLDSFSCLGCGVRGNAITLLKTQEGISYSAAQRLAEELALGSDTEVPRKPARITGRKVYGEPRSDDPGGQAVRPGIRDRPRRWT